MATNHKCAKCGTINKVPHNPRDHSAFVGLMGGAMLGASIGNKINPDTGAYIGAIIGGVLGAVIVGRKPRRDA